MRTRLLILLAAATAALALSCDQRPADPALPTVDVQATPIKRFDYELSTKAIWASSPTDIYTGRTSYESSGDVFFSDDPLIRHFDGTQWVDVDLPIEDEGGKTSIWGSGPDDVYVAVSSLYHFDGLTWKKELDNARVITGSAANDVFAANYDGIFHYDGSEWDTLLVDPRFDFTIFSAPDASLWAVASDSILVWNTGSWRAISDSHPYYGALIIPFSSSDAVLVLPRDSYFGDAKTEAFRWNASQWILEATLPVTLNAAWAESPSSIYAVGDRGESWHFDGTSWKEMSRPTGLDLDAIAGMPGGAIVAAGSYGKVVSFDGSSWHTLHEALFAPPARIWAESATRFITSYYGVMFKQDGAQWSEVVPPFNTGIAAMGGTSLDNLFVAAPGGTMYHYDGSDWDELTILDGNQNGMWVSKSGTLITAGDNSVYHFDGAWVPLLRGELGFNAVAGNERGEILCAGHTNAKFYDGSVWHNLSVPDDGIFDVWLSPEGESYLAGYLGLYKWNGSKFARVTPRLDDGLITIIGLDTKVLGFGYGQLVVYDRGITNIQPTAIRAPVIQARNGDIIGQMGYGLGVWKQ